MSAKRSPAGKSPAGGKKSPGSGVKGIGKSRKVSKARGKDKTGPKSMEELDAELTSYTAMRNTDAPPAGDAPPVPVA